MTLICAKLRPVDISAALDMLPSTKFVDSGGTNGWIAQPQWLSWFVPSLALEGAVLHAVCRKLPAGQGIPPHVDPKMYEEGAERRYHVPLITHPAVTMRWPLDGVEMHLEAGYLYEVSFDRMHEVVHRAPIDRVHVQIHVGT